MIYAILYITACSITIWYISKTAVLIHIILDFWCIRMTYLLISFYIFGLVSIISKNNSIVRFKWVIKWFTTSTSRRSFRNYYSYNKIRRGIFTFREVLKNIPEKKGKGGIGRTIPDGIPVGIQTKYFRGEREWILKGGYKTRISWWITDKGLGFCYDKE